MEKLFTPRPRNADEKFCHDCGWAISKHAETCSRCGERQPSANATRAVTVANPAVAPNGKHRMVASLLAFFLGNLGAHKFYLGQVWLGVLYMVFFWTLIPGVVALVELCFLASMTDEEFVQRYGHI